jgi:hypothetical protein
MLAAIIITAAGIHDDMRVTAKTLDD